MIKVVKHGNFSKLNSFFQKKLSAIKLDKLDIYGKQGVEALKQWTPKDTGKTSESWVYNIVKEKDKIILSWNNTNVTKDWCNIAIILQYGHATKNGGWVEGIDYINPALQPLFKKFAKAAWEEVIAK